MSFVLSFSFMAGSRVLSQISSLYNGYCLDLSTTRAPLMQLSNVPSGSIASSIVSLMQPMMRFCQYRSRTSASRYCLQNHSPPVTFFGSPHSGSIPFLKSEYSSTVFPSGELSSATFFLHSPSKNTSDGRGRWDEYLQKSSTVLKAHSCFIFSFHFSGSFDPVFALCSHITHSCWSGCVSSVIWFSKEDVVQGGQQLLSKSTFGVAWPKQRT
mmetsp:Transcript_34554/g.83446  ORF Transcript_34554/g.83446 Transcript_34554/m.83446 type:complete len:212 (-) Transcript_34554:37-672(-)